MKICQAFSKMERAIGIVLDSRARGPDPNIQMGSPERGYTEPVLICVLPRGTRRRGPGAWPEEWAQLQISARVQTFLWILGLGMDPRTRSVSSPVGEPCVRVSPASPLREPGSPSTHGTGDGEAAH